TIPANGGKIKKKPNFVGSAPIVWKIRLICELCNEKAIDVPKLPKVINIKTLIAKLGIGFRFFPCELSITQLPFTLFVMQTLASPYELYYKRLRFSLQPFSKN